MRRLRNAFLRYQVTVIERALWILAFTAAAWGYWYAGLPQVVPACYIRWLTWRREPRCGEDSHRCACGTITVGMQIGPSRPTRPPIAFSRN